VLTRNKYTFQNFILRARGLIERQYRVKEWLYPLELSKTQKNSDLLRIYKPVVIIGCGRSGSTMLFNMLNEHKQLIPARGFPDGEDTEMWVKVGGALIAGFGGKHSQLPVGHCLCLPMGENDIDLERINYFHQYCAKKYPRLRDKQFRLLSKNGHLSNKVKYIHKIFPDVKLIHIIRHPYATIASWKAILAQCKNLLIEVPNNSAACINIYPNKGWDKVIGIMNKNNPDLYNPYDIESIRLLARYWLNINSYIIKQVNQISNINYYKVKYEDLFIHQRQVTEKILDFCEISPKDHWTLKIDKIINEKWRNQLSYQECMLIKEELNDEIENLGYELPQF